MYVGCRLSLSPKDKMLVAGRVKLAANKRQISKKKEKLNDNGQRACICVTTSRKVFRVARNHNQAVGDQFKKKRTLIIERVMLNYPFFIIGILQTDSTLISNHAEEGAQDHDPTFIFIT